ncbi:hypothetical protein F0562_006382 [Nyssa sinensis]|uniref:J domain-containing protein n=1 Tax=Nyssa sinensis TaxID=561372 RepID=A0A5J5AS83_9ASTE|nr:hypothetical protein F0562_006382 [Nyssa sinensis]
MENLSNSLSRKSYNGNGFAAKAVYDDVFGGPPKFGVATLSPRVEDYTEIFRSFHTSRASSIPILDLPVVDEVDVSFDVRSSKFDYSEVFSGFNGLDLAISYEELFNQSNAGDDSSEEAWTPAQSESLSDESDPSACSEKNQSLSNGNSYESLDGLKQFNISYHKANQRSKENMSNGMTHVAQLHAVPGFIYEVNETLPRLENENTLLQGTSDLNLSMDFNGRIKEGKQLRKTMSHPANGSLGIQTFGSALKPLNKRCSSLNGTFLTVSDISLQTNPSQLPPPSRPPPVLAVKEADCGRQNSKLKASKSYDFEQMASDNSPPFFDVEVDASSSAAASAAAMKDAMEKAQAKLKSAKELMERKKEGLQSCKLGLKNDKKVKEGEVSKFFDGSTSFNNERVQGTCDLDGSGMKAFAAEERKKVTKTTRAVSDSIEGERHINVAKKAVEKKHGWEYSSSQAFHKTDRTVAWRELPFSEVVEVDKSKKVIEQSNDENILVHNTKSHDCGQEKKAAMEAFDHQEKNNRKIKAAREAPEWKEKENKSEVAEGAWEWDEYKGRSKATKESLVQEEHENKIKVAQMVCQQAENEKKLRVGQRHGDIERILTEADKYEENEKLEEVPRGSNGVNVTQKLKEVNERIKNEKRFEDAHEREDKGRKVKETVEREEHDKRLTEAIEQKENEKRQKEALEQEEKEIQEKVAHEREENEKRLKETYEREEKEKRLNDALKSEVDEKRLKEALEWEENEKKHKLAYEREENEKRLVEALKQEENQKKLKEALEQEENAKKQKEAYEREENEKRINEACEREDKEKSKEAWEVEENKQRLQEAHESEESEKRLEEAFKQEEIEKRSEKVSEWEETDIGLKDAGKWKVLNGQSKDHEQMGMDGNEKKPKPDQETRVHMERENLKASDGACKLGDNKKQYTQVACKNKNSGKLEMTKEVLSCEEDGVVRTELRGSERELEAVELENVQFEEIINSCIMVEDGTQLEKNQIRTEDDNESLCVHDSVKKLVEDGIGIGQTHIESKKKALEMASDSENHVFTHERGERGTHMKELQVTFDPEESKDRLMSSHIEKKMGISLPVVLEGTRNAQKTAPKVGTRQSSERKEKNLNETLTPEEREKEARMKRERELEKDHLRKIEEEREREREREKDRMAVERATREACDRAFAEARGRAERAAVERATAEVRLRAMAEARERLEKASAEARERMLTDKASVEARLRAERAAVERATAEARERAFEKAMAEKAAFGARERAERSIADKLFTASRDGVRHCSSSSDLQFQGLGSSSGSRYSHSSVYGGVEGESAQRCKARLERHQRTAERAACVFFPFCFALFKKLRIFCLPRNRKYLKLFLALFQAKALAEKNMRDLLAQREQAERNRLAEVLDAEVKRWSSGKEGNLRALLSTLQYILGPDSGWQPIPLTEVITSVAVKKAYRKATLCVHPDKLQQRGASIQQKYICEKVFDLLKEAWNKFNSEER